MRFRILWVLWLVMLINACASVEKPLNPKIYYKHDMVISVNGYARQGLLVAKRAPKYQIQIIAQEDMDLLQISTCARDLDRPAGLKIESGFWTGRRTYSFEYAPNNVEQEKGCNVLKIAGFNQKDGKHSWSFIVMEDPRFTLPAGIACNDDPDYTANGVSACQNLEGLFAKIWFAVPVHLSEKTLERCKLPIPADEKHWQFNVPNRECVFDFVEKAPPYRRHQLYTVGYEDVPIRSVK